MIAPIMRSDIAEDNERANPKSERSDEINAGVEFVPTKTDALKLLARVLFSIETGFIAQHSARAERHRNELEASIRTALGRAK